MAPPAIGSQVSFSGTVANSFVLRGSTRFAEGPIGVRFTLEEPAGVLFLYVLPSIEEGAANGVLEKHPDGQLRYADLAGRHVAGTATVRSAESRDVVSLRVVARE